MNDLLAKLDETYGPDREIDRAIARVCNIVWSSEEEGQFGGYGIMPRRVRFTELVDAALTLVPEDANYFSIVHNKDFGFTAVIVGRGGQYFESKRALAGSHGLPLVLCTAALMALAGVGGTS